MLMNFSTWAEMKRQFDRDLLQGFVKHLHETGALSVPPEDLVVAVDEYRP
jgi:hypothetical protein